MTLITTESGTSIHASASWIQPIIRRDTTTTLLRLTRNEVLALIAELSRHHANPDGPNDEIILVVEGGGLYPQEVFE